MEWADAGRAAGVAGAIADQLRSVFEQLDVELVHPPGVADPAWIDLEDGDRRQLRRDGSHFGDRPEVARVAHQAQAGDVPQRVGYSLQPRLKSLAAERAPQRFVDGDPVTGRVQRLLGQVDRSCADVLVRVEADLLEHRREARDLHLAVTPRQSVVTCAVRAPGVAVGTFER